MSAPEDSCEVSRPPRPRFNSQVTSDRLREGAGKLPSFSMPTNIKQGRKSVFRELGLDGTDAANPTDAGPAEHDFARSMTASDAPILSGPASEARADVVKQPFFRRRKHQPNSSSGTAAEANQDITDSDDTVNTTPTPRPDCQVAKATTHPDDDDGSYVASPSSVNTSQSSRPWYSIFSSRRQRANTASAVPGSGKGWSRLTSLALLIAVVLPALSLPNFRTRVEGQPVNAQVVSPRANSPTTVCARWAQQVADVNGTLYIYGGEARTSSDQTDNTWNNNLLTVDLTSDWDISSPGLSGLPQPSGPPSVALGALWHDLHNLYLYGGEFADNPYASPAPIATWQYSISGRSWKSFDNPKTSSGNASAPGGQPVQRAAEGASISVPELGVSWYFGGHLDWATTPGWSRQTDRVYLKSLLEFTHPGYNNDAVDELHSSGALDGGAYRNITQGGLQGGDMFTERADGVLVFVPGWGTKGVLIGLAGGTNDTFTNDLGTLDVYDIANSQWYHQQTTGDIPSVRVNLCAAVAVAPDASSFQVYMYGGQNLVPYKEQVQYSDLYVLTIPSFTWIKADPDSSDKSSVPRPRAGHTCTMRDGQMVVVGGYIGPPSSNSADACDSPGVYVLNASSLSWEPSFRAVAQAANPDPENSVQAGSVGYHVPAPVVSVIGGGPDGRATVTSPAAGVTGGPFATGKAPVFTVTAAAQTATITSGANGGKGSSGSQAKLVVASVFAALAGLGAIYLGFCAWIYHRQVRAYREHVAEANRYSGGTTRPGGAGGEKAALAAAAASHANGHKKGASDGDGSFDDTFAWVGAQGVEPKWVLDSAGTPGSNNSGSGATDTLTGGGSNTGSGALVPPVAARTDDSGHLVRSPYSPFSPSPGGPTAAGAGNGGGGGGGHVGSSAVAGGYFGNNSFHTPRNTTVGATTEYDPGRSSADGTSNASSENLLDGQEPSFFNVVLGPRRALRVVNGTSD